MDDAPPVFGRYEWVYERALMPALPDWRIADMLHVTSQVISAASGRHHESAYLMWVRDRLVALLVEAEDGWFLQFGLGPFEAEGLIFSSIGEAEDWIRGCVPAGWADAP
jgi:hypothetical protein